MKNLCWERGSLTVTGYCQPFFRSSLAAGVRPPSLTTWAFPKGYSSHANQLPPAQVISKRKKKGECAEDRTCRVFSNFSLEMTYHRFYPLWLVAQMQLWHGVGGEYAGCEHQKAGWWGHLGGWLPQWYLCLVFLSMLKHVPSHEGGMFTRDPRKMSLELRMCHWKPPSPSNQYKGPLDRLNATTMRVWGISSRLLICTPRDGAKYYVCPLPFVHPRFYFNILVHIFWFPSTTGMAHLIVHSKSV